MVAFGESKPEQAPEPTPQFVVKKCDERPARQDGTCFYCRQPIGQQHAKGCVLRTRRNVVRYTIEICQEDPEDWDKQSVEFRYNKSSWCANNLVQDLQEFIEHNPDSCLCPNVSLEYLRPATPEDEKHLGVLGRDYAREEAP